MTCSGDDDDDVSSLTPDVSAASIKHFINVSANDIPTEINNDLSLTCDDHDVCWKMPAERATVNNEINNDSPASYDSDCTEDYDWFLGWNSDEVTMLITAENQQLLDSVTGELYSICNDFQLTSDHNYCTVDTSSTEHQSDAFPDGTVDLSFPSDADPMAYSAVNDIELETVTAELYPVNNNLLVLNTCNDTEVMLYTEQYETLQHNYVGESDSSADDAHNSRKVSRKRQRDEANWLRNK